ncbi:MAG: hypothetical protein MH204_07885, partial [Fimbriimonadaceae bacterium]|nr:hypothetical protein [Fimbriimonadaceae bacterium]
MADSTMNWTARWVAPHPDPAHCLGATVFRRTFELDAVPESLVVQVSADERYRLYVNGRLAIFGPCRGDRFFWHYEEPDLVPFLKPGRNVIHAVIWAQGSGAPLAQMSHRPGFFLQGPGMDTPNGWEGARLPGRSWRWGHPGMASTYMCVGAEESVELGIALEDLGEADLPWRTIQPFWTGRVDADEVEGPISLGSGYSFGMPEGGSHWCLTPRPIPPMVYSPWTGRLMRVDPETDARTPLDGPFTLGPGESILLDAGELLNAYPRLRFTGAGRAKVGYAEALFRVMPDGSPNWEKFDRNETVGRTFFGLEDVVSGSGIFEPLWWRCFRYLRITAESAVSVEIDSILETGYPIEAESSWESDGLDHRPIWDMCLRTVRRCAGENYFDCPYYEQLQYVGDSRIQAQIGRFLSRDRRLQRHCIESFSRSQLGNGLLQSRYPCRDFQVIPGFSLWWIHMMQDALLYDTEPLDPKWIRQADAILEWWGGALESGTDSVFWAYADWVDGWPMGEPPGRLQSMVQRLHFHWTQAVRASLTGDAA